MAYIGRPLADWSRPLTDPAWRRWFDILKEQGVESIGPTYPAGPAWSLPTTEATPSGVYSTREYGAPIRALRQVKPRRQRSQAMPEGHEEFMKRYGRG